MFFCRKKNYVGLIQYDLIDFAGSKTTQTTGKKKVI